MIQSNPKIKSINYGNLKLLLSLFADDVSIFLPNDAQSWTELQSTIKNFEEISGLKVNYDKTDFYRIGSLDSCRALAYITRQLHWSEGPVKLLGLYIGADRINDYNLDPIFKTAEAIIQTWKTQGLSILGSITVFNSLIASLFMYRLTVLNLLQNSHIQQYNNLACVLIW